MYVLLMAFGLGLVVAGQPVSACLECSQLSECESTSTSGWCECTEKIKLFQDGTTWKICRGSGTFCVGGSTGCDDDHTPPAVVIDPPPTMIADQVGVELRRANAIYGALILALTDEAELALGASGGVVRFEGPEGRPPRVFRYEATTMREGRDGAAIEILYGSYGGELDASVMGWTQASGRRGFLRMIDADGERQLRWDLDHTVPFDWSR